MIQVLLISLKQKLNIQKGGQFRLLPPGNIAPTAHVHFPFQNKDIERCKHDIRDEDDEVCHSQKEKEYTVVNDHGDEENYSKEINQERKSTNADDPRKGACSFSDYTTNIDSRLLYNSRVITTGKMKMTTTGL